jgi:hypothetical protein
MIRVLFLLLLGWVTLDNLIWLGTAVTGIVSVTSANFYTRVLYPPVIFVSIPSYEYRKDVDNI